MSKYHQHPITFHSKLITWLEHFPSNKAPAKQWEATLNGLNAIRKDEVVSLGLFDYLNSYEPNEKVLKEELLSVATVYLKAHLPINLMTQKNATFKPSMRMQRFNQDILPKKVRKLLANATILDCIKLSSFNYRIIKYKFDGGWCGSIETCIIFDNKWNRLEPRRCYSLLQAVDYLYSVIAHKFQKFNTTSEYGRYEYFSSLGKKSQYQEWLLQLPHWPGGFDGDHFSLKNVILHMRTSRWVDIRGDSLLLIDEVQSDWHAAGGYDGYHVIGESPVENQVPDAPFAKEWHELGVKVALSIAIRKGMRRISFVKADVQIERYGMDLDSFHQLYNKKIPATIAKLAKQFDCKLSTTHIEVKKPKHNIKYSKSYGWTLKSHEKTSEDQTVMNLPVVMMYLKSKGSKHMREIDVLEISDSLYEEITKRGIPMFGQIERLKN